MADVQLSDQDTLTAAELDDSIIAIQGGNPKRWLKVTPAELMELLGISTETDVLRQLIATMPMPAGTYSSYQSPDFNNNFFPNWSIESGITGFSLIDAPVSSFYGVPSSITDAVLVTPDLPVNNAQTGWSFELTNGNTVVGELLVPIDNISTPVLTSSDDTDIQIVVWAIPDEYISALTSVAFAFTPNSDFTIDASDDYNISLYTA